MLNQPLYDALERLFGSVTVVNEGVTAAISPSPSGDGTWSIPQGDEHGEQYRVNCPFCKDHKQHLYISYLSFVSPVLNGTELRIGPLLGLCFRRNCLKNPENVDFLTGNIANALSSSGTAAVRIDMSETVQEPESKVSHDLSLEGLRTWVPDWNLVDSNTDPAILTYLAERRITQADIDWLQIGWGPVTSPRTQEKLNNGLPWVLFPIVQNGKLAGIQARCPDVYLRADGIKYYTHPGLRKRTVVYNIDIASSLGVGVLCEGVFDVASVGKPGICIFGHTPSVTQKRIITSHLRGVILLPDTDYHPDFDTVAEARKYAQEWNQAGVFPLGAHVVVLPEKDAGSMTRTAIWENIIQQVPATMQDYLMVQVLPKL